ncbi:MAG: carbohydrate porin [Gluconacetobacter diazotrophicus]|nr:carbohydrate porin [Gluconacetobacter diazotrophicus]
MGGLRPFLARGGLSVGLAETDEVIGNPAGGVRRGADYEGLTVMGLGLDTAALGWSGGVVDVSALQVHGRNLSGDDLGTLQTASGIEADRSTRLWELWFQQTLFGGRVDVKLGQQSLDQEFLVSQGSSLFVNTAMGWPIVPSLDLYAGGPAYPLSSLGVRLRARLDRNVALLAGVFDDDPSGGPFGDDSQTRGAEQSGAAFSTTNGALLIAELQYALNPAPAAPPTLAGPSQAAPAPALPDTSPPPPGLPGIYKLGFYFDTAAFPDRHRDDHGLSLADPDSDGIPRQHRHAWSIYGVADQTLWRPAPDSPRAFGIFLRVQAGPGSASLLDLGVNGGVVLKDPLSGRDNDTAGLGFGVAKIGSAARDLDRDAARFAGSPLPVRSAESFVELTYQAQIRPWWILQPDLQWVLRPGGGVPRPDDPSRRVGNALVLGLRTNVNF